MSDVAPCANEAVHELVLTWKRFSLMRTVPDCVRDAKIEGVYDHMVQGMLVRATSHVLGEQLPSHTETTTAYTHFEVPASWWQHLKYQHGQRWWLRTFVKRRPARMDHHQRGVTLTATWEQMQAYPWAEVATFVPPEIRQRLGEPVRLRWITSTTNWRDAE